MSKITSVSTDLTNEIQDFQNCMNNVKFDFGHKEGDVSFTVIFSLNASAKWSFSCCMIIQKRNKVILILYYVEGHKNNLTVWFNENLTVWFNGPLTVLAVSSSYQNLYRRNTTVVYLFTVFSFLVFFVDFIDIQPLDAILSVFHIAQCNTAR